MKLEEIMSVVPTEVLVTVGGIAIFLLLALLGLLGKLLIDQIKKSLAETRESVKKQALEGLKEREYDNYLLLKGMQVIGDCEHELIYCVIHGEHNGGLEKASNELENFRKLSNENLVAKAAKYNLNNAKIAK